MQIIFIILVLQCSFVSGDGTGGTETKIGSQKGSACIKACIELKKTDSSINGVTVIADNRPGCWCEKSMTGVSPSGTYKTCFLKAGKCTMMLSH